MDETTLQAITENDREWRRYMVRTIEEIRHVGVENTNDIAKLKVWNLMWRFFGVTLFSFLLYLVRDKLF